MIVVAGPPGGGKSSLFPVSSFGISWVYDNSKVGGPPKRVLQSEKGVIHFLSDDPPDWLIAVLDLS
jgi:hypothetical protein